MSISSHCTTKLYVVETLSLYVPVPYSVLYDVGMPFERRCILGRSSPGRTYSSPCKYRYGTTNKLPVVASRGVSVGTGTEVPVHNTTCCTYSPLAIEYRYRSYDVRPYQTLCHPFRLVLTVLYVACRSEIKVACIGSVAAVVSLSAAIVASLTSLRDPFIMNHSVTDTSALSLVITLTKASRQVASTVIVPAEDSIDDSSLSPADCSVPAPAHALSSA